MKYIITETQNNRIIKSIEDFLNRELSEIKIDAESDDFESSYDVYAQIVNLVKIVVTNYDYDSVEKRKIITIDLYKSGHYHYFNDVIDELQSRLKRFIGDCELKEDNLFDTRRHGPGIDW